MQNRTISSTLLPFMIHLKKIHENDEVQKELCNARHLLLELCKKKNSTYKRQIDTLFIYNVSLCLFIWLNEVIKTLPHFCYSIRCLLLEINILGFFLHIICTYHMGLSEAHVYIWCFPKRMYIFEVCKSYILMISSTCIYLKYVQPIYLYYGAFQSTCTYLNFVNILSYDPLSTAMENFCVQHLTTWSDPSESTIIAFWIFNYHLLV